MIVCAKRNSWPWAWAGLLLIALSPVLAGPDAPKQSSGPAATHWSFVPPQRPPLPRVTHTDWPRNAIDRFILARLEQEQLEPSPEAARPTLLRRVCFDLTGLPPTPAEVDRFLGDSAPDAYEKLVERLLDSPDYGEQWARHWLDLARYADSDGYEKDTGRPYAYLYRDWVIDALNRDLPFDQFTLEQLAGDLLADATPEQKVATGFHRQTLTNKEGGVDQEEYRCKAVVDRVSTTSTVWLGLTVGCAECHSHKYDPISQREFYQFYAFFNNASEREFPRPTFQEQEDEAEARARWEQKAQRLADEKASFDGPTNSVAWTNLLQAIDRHRERAPKTSERKASILEEEHQPRETRIHVRGDFLRRGDLVEPGTLAVLHPFVPRRSRPDRLDLAQWLMAPSNPLTARVTVNRIWRHLFGRGLVATVDDFGTRGERPSHPELLDWLATEFPRLGWSQKALLRRLVLSATYRQSSSIRPQLQERDPGNILLARQTRLRLEAENVRDAALAVSGLLEPRLGGPSVRPPLPADIAAVGYANSVKWPESTGADQFRRGLYIFFQRTVPYPMLTTFDAPDSNVTCTRRERSNTPLQALTLLNDPVFFACAQALGRQLATAHASDPASLVRAAFASTLARPPHPAEQKRLEEYYRAQLGLARRRPAEAPPAKTPSTHADSSPELTAAVLVARTLLNLDEFVNRE